MLQVIFIFISNIEVIKHQSYCFKKILLWVDFKTFFKIVGTLFFFFLVVSFTRTDIPYKFLSIPKLIRTLFVVSLSGGYAHDFHSTEVRAQTVESVTAFV